MRKILPLALLYIFFVIWVYLPAAAVHASLDVIYKEPKNMKSLQPGKAVSPPKADSQLSGQTDEKPFSYDPTGKTDPFKPFIVEKEAVEEKKEERPKTYLETLDISQLDLIAVILSAEGNFAMVRDAKGLGYTVRVGTPIGKKEGVIHEIRDDAIVIREKETDFRGRAKSKDVVKEILQAQ